MPEAQDSKRQLSAILFVDIQGYTSMMQQDEAKAAALLTRFQEVIASEVSNFKGSIANDMGDGMLCVFGAPNDAVRCAMALKVAFDQSPTVPVRMGIHSGTVVFKSDKVYGNSINIASRIESMGKPGMVLVSNKVRDDILNQVDIQLTAIGDFDFKHVAEPVTIFAVSNPGYLVPNKGELKGKFKEKKSIFLSLPFITLVIFIVGLMAIFGKDIWGIKTDYSNIDYSSIKKSIAVLPFTNESPNEENVYFCNGVMQSIINHLSKIEDIRVVPRTSIEQFRNNSSTTQEIGNALNVAFILQGSVQRMADKAIIFANLIDTKNERSVWSISYDRELTNLFEVQSEITQEIARELHAFISPSVKNRIQAIPTTSTIAYDYYLQGNEFLSKQFSMNQTSVEWLGYLGKAQLFYEQALERDSLFADAFVGLAKVDIARNLMSTIEDEDYLNPVLNWTNKAISINPNLSEAYLVRSRYYSFHSMEKEEKEDLERTIQLNPNNIKALYYLTTFYTRNDLDYPKAAELLKKIESRTYTLDDKYQLYNYYSWFYFDLGDMERSERFALLKESLKPELNSGLWLIYGTMGRWKEYLAWTHKDFPVENQFKLAMLGAYYNQQRKFKESIPYFQKWGKLVKKESETNWQSQQTWKRYGMALMETGETAKGKKMLDRAIEFKTNNIESGRFKNVDAMYTLAGVYAYLGETELAFYWFDKYEAHNGWLIEANHTVFIEHDIFLDKLRDNDRFKAMKARVIQQRTKNIEEVRRLLPLRTPY